MQGEENTRGKGRDASFQVKHHPTGFIGSADDIIFSTEPTYLSIETPNLCDYVCCEH